MFFLSLCSFVCLSVCFELTKGEVDKIALVYSCECVLFLWTALGILMILPLLLLWFIAILVCLLAFLFVVLCVSICILYQKLAFCVLHIKTVFFPAFFSFFGACP